MLSYTPNKLIQNVVIFGVGGSGARVASLICQQLMTEEHTSHTKVILMDGDVVETKNCRRQLFIPADVGKNKADVIANRYSKAFKSNIISIPSFFPSTDVVTDFFLDISTNPYRYVRELGDISEEYRVLLSLIRAMSCKDADMFEASSDNTEFHIKVDANKLYLKMSSGITVFILAVDSIPARLSILDFITKLATIPNIVSSNCAMAYRGDRGDSYGNLYGIAHPPGVTSLAENLVVIDGGNEDSFGQVCYFHPVQFSLCPDEIADLIPERSPYRFHTPVVPMPTGRYLNMQEGTSTRRCGDMDQTLAINNLVATCMHVIFQNLFYNTPMTFNRISFGLNGAFSSEYMGLKWLKGVLTTDRNYLFGTIPTEDSKGKGVSSLAQVQEMSKVSAARYGLWDQTMNSVIEDGRTDVVVGMLLGVSTTTVGNKYVECNSTITRPLAIPRQSDLLYYLDEGLSDEGSLRPKWSDGEKGLSLLTRTTFLDISWSEILGQILHKHFEKGLFDKVNEINDLWEKYRLHGLHESNRYQSLSMCTTCSAMEGVFTPEIANMGYSGDGLRIGYSCVSNPRFYRTYDLIRDNRKGILTARLLNTDTYELARVSKFIDMPCDEDEEYGNEHIMSTGMALLVSMIKPIIELKPLEEIPETGNTFLVTQYSSVECVRTPLQSVWVDTVSTINISYNTLSEIKDVYDSSSEVTGIINSSGIILTEVYDIVTCLSRMSVSNYLVCKPKVREKLSLLQYGIVMYLLLANGRKKMIDPLISYYGKDVLLGIFESLISLYRSGDSRVMIQSSPLVSLGISEGPILSLGAWIRTNVKRAVVEEEPEDEYYEEEYDEYDEDEV